MFLYGGSKPPPYDINPISVSIQNKKLNLSSAFSFAIAAAKEKAIKKKTPEEDFALCGARQGQHALDLASLPKGLT